MIRVFKFLVRFVTHTEEREFTLTKTGEYMPYYGGPSAHDVSKPVGKGYEPPQGSIERWASHEKNSNRGHKS